tara:strand:+ start:2148 stop:2864 length:717 start_codon:yes stop_codon:yes gene_type:complete
MKIYLFDIDGTLTEPREKMSGDITVSFLSWMTNKNVYLVTGSDYPKVVEQVPNSILSRCNGIFCSMANQFIQKEQVIYEKKWKPSMKLTADLTRVYLECDYPKELRSTNYLEERTGMLNFSIVGRNATPKEREMFCRWDKTNNERKKIARLLSTKHPDLDFKIGGQISIDIQPKGMNKAQASKWLRKKFKNCKLHFFGDKCSTLGNDYDIVKDIQEHGDGKIFDVSGPKETMSILLRD